jgi:hypothetical protein
MPAYVNDHWGGGHAPTPQPVPAPNAPAVNFSGDPFEVADAKTRYAARTFNEYVEQVNSIPNLDERQKAQALESFANTAAARDAEASVSAARAYRDQLAVRPDAERATLTTASDPAAQTNAVRQWERDQRLLDAQSSVGQIYSTARNLVNNATPEQLAVLAEELPSYLKAKGQPSTWVNDALAQAAPQLGEAREQAAEADRKVLKLQHNHRATANAYKAHRPVNPGVLVNPT